jgi:hypothetical protein
MAWLQMLVALGMLVVGCGENVLYQRLDRQMWSSYIHLQDVKLGMSKSEVEGIMGPPRVKEEGDYRGGHFVFYFYLTHSMDFEESNTVRGGYTPLVFKEDRLVGIGKRDYRMAVERPEDGRFPGLPWHRVQ